MTKPQFKKEQTDPFLTTRKAAEQMGVSLRTVQIWVEAGKLSSGKTLGGHRRIRQSAVDQLRKAGGYTPTPKEFSQRKKEVLICLSNAEKMQGWTDAVKRSNELNSTWTFTTNQYETLLRAGTRQYDLIVVDTDCVDFSWGAAIRSVSGMKLRTQWIALKEDRKKTWMVETPQDAYNLTYEKYPTNLCEFVQKLKAWSSDT